MNCITRSRPTDIPTRLLRCTESGARDADFVVTGERAVKKKPGGNTAQLEFALEAPPRGDGTLSLHSTEPMGARSNRLEKESPAIASGASFNMPQAAA